MNKPQFEVAAGKLEASFDPNASEQFERNYKYIDTFDTFEAALAAYNSCRDYHFNDLVYIDAKGDRYLMELTKQ